MKLKVLAIVVLASVISCRTPTPAPKLTAVENYQSLIQAALIGRTPGGVEAAFAAVSPLSDALLHVDDNHRTLLEGLSNAEFEKLRSDLPGLIVNREEVVFVKPDPGYFRK